MLFLAAFMIFVSLMLLGYAASGMARTRQDEKAALDRRVAAMTGTPTEPEQASILKDLRLSGIGLLNSLLQRLTMVEPLVKMIRQAGIKKRAGEVLLYIPLLACLGILVVVTLNGSALLAIGAGAIGAVAPIVVVHRKRQKRLALFAEQLPDALDLIRAALQAGHAFVSALNVVANEFPDPIAEEFREAAEEMRLGLPMRDALAHLCQRTEDENLPVMTVGVLVTQEVGGNLAEVLDNISYTIRERFKLLRETRVLTAQGRLSGMLLSILPFAVGAAVCLMNPTYFAPMLETPTGRYMIAYAVTSILCGHLIITRITNIKV